MASSPWLIAQDSARLASHLLTGTIALDHPAPGLQVESVQGQPWSAARLLAVALPGQADRPDARSVDRYVRGADFVVAFQDPAGLPYRVDALWRAIGEPFSSDQAGGIELVLSLRTSMPVVRAPADVLTSLPWGPVLRRAGRDGFCREPLAKPASMPTADERGVCMLVRPADAPDLSLAQMVHPADGCATAVQRADTPPSAVSIRHRLFAFDLEKGVMLRARVRVLFLARRDDEQLAAEAYREFAASEHPLDT